MTEIWKKKREGRADLRPTAGRARAGEVNMQKVKSERERQEMSCCRLHCERQNSSSLRFDTEHISQTSKASQPAERSTLLLKHTHTHTCSAI